jgi:hypothetical protein
MEAPTQLIPQFVVDNKEVKIDERIGNGSFSSVSAGNTGYVIKVLNYKNLRKDRMGLFDGEVRTPISSDSLAFLRNTHLRSSLNTPRTAASTKQKRSSKGSLDGNCIWARPDIWKCPS